MAEAPQKVHPVEGWGNSWIGSPAMAVRANWAAQRPGTTLSSAHINGLKRALPGLLPLKVGESWWPGPLATQAIRQHFGQAGMDVRPSPG